MNEFLKVLYNEHTIIVNAIDIARQSAELININNTLYEKTVRELIRFFRLYADQYHHYKEEDILFPEMAKKNEMLSEGVLKEMLENHDDFRELIQNIEANLNVKNYEKTQQLIFEYTDALLDHIAVENEEVFIIAESLFSEIELENLKYKFEDCDRELGLKLKIDFEEMSSELRKAIILEND